MAGSDDPPRQARDDQRPHHVAGDDVGLELIFLGEVRHEERGDQGPVEQADERVPYFDAGLCRHAAPCSLLFLDDRLTGCEPPLFDRRQRTVRL